MRNKLYLTLLACSICYTGYAGWFGTGIRMTNRTMRVHPSNYSLFISGYKPDSAVLVYRQPKYFGKPSDSSSVIFEIRGTSILSATKKEIDFYRDESLNKQLVQRLLANSDVAYYRLFYRNAGGEIYKYQDISIKGKKTKEAVLTDATLQALEIQKFYETAVVSNRTQYIVGKRDSLERKRLDSLWFDLNPKLVKSGREDIYYANQNPLLTRVYERGVLKDSVYNEMYSNGVIKKSYSTKGGALHGPARSFDKQGKLQEELLFEKGIIKKIILANKNYDNRKKALLFGIDKYEVPPGVKVIKWKTMYSGWMNLAGCVNDVDTLRQALVSYNSFNPANILSVTDDEATRDKMLASFNRFTGSLQKGDFVFLHFSSSGNLVQDMIDTDRKYEGLVLACRDANYPRDSGFANSNHIFQFQLVDFFNTIKKKIGKSGQLVISMDVCHSGQLLSYNTEDSVRNQQGVISRRGESNNVLFNLVKDESAPVIIYTATNNHEFGYEMIGENGKSYGAYSLALAGLLASPWSLNSTEIHEEIAAFLKRNSKPQTPGYLASETQYLFEGSDVNDDAEKNMVRLPALKPTGNVFLLSAGITDYTTKSGEKLSFKNCEADANKYAVFFQKQFEDIGGIRDKKKLFSSLLLNKDATKENILAAINNAISNSKPDDYFIFNFSGYCKPLKDSSGKQVTWFVPYGLRSISDSAEIREKGISLTQLKDLLQMIPANNQLFITEAGSTDDFQKEFIQALIETSPTIASLSNKNRIFIVPNGSGLDNFSCNNTGQEHGPINYFVTNLSDELNVFGLFEGGIYADAVKFNLNKTAVDCNFFRTAYFDVFFERDFIRDIRYFLPEEVMQSRGAGMINKDKAAVANAIAKKYALLVGTNTYSGKPQWTDLEGIPVLDVTSIGDELSKNYGFNVIPLVDKPADSIYESIIRLSKILKPNDQLMIYVAGHGDYDEKLFDDGFIVCANSKQAKDDPYRNSYIQYSKLSRMINKLPASQVMMVLDVCFGGSFAEKVVRCSNRSGYEDLSSADYVAGKLKLRTRLFLSSGGKKEVPNGYKGRLSPFAQRFLQCLQTKGGDGKLLSSSSFYEFVKKLPSGPVIGSFGDDECGSEFLMLSK